MKGKVNQGRSLYRWDHSGLFSALFPSHFRNTPTWLHFHKGNKRLLNCEGHLCGKDTEYPHMPFSPSSARGPFCCLKTLVALPGRCSQRREGVGNGNLGYSLKDRGKAMEPMVS